MQHNVSPLAMQIEISQVVSKFKSCSPVGLLAYFVFVALFFGPFRMEFLPFTRKRFRFRVYGFFHVTQH